VYKNWNSFCFLILGQKKPSRKKKKKKKKKAMAVLSDTEKRNLAASLIRDAVRCVFFCHFYAIFCHFLPFLSFFSLFLPFFSSQIGEKCVFFRRVFFFSSRLDCFFCLFFRFQVRKNNSKKHIFGCFRAVKLNCEL
jgi:hypothetical protein